MGRPGLFQVLNELLGYRFLGKKKPRTMPGLVSLVGLGYPRKIYVPI